MAAKWSLDTNPRPTYILISHQYLQFFNWKYDSNCKSYLFLLLRKLNLCSTGVQIKPLTRLLKACHTLEHLNLAGCRSLPRPMKKCYTNREAIVQLKVDILAGKFNNDDDEDDDWTIAKINKQRKTTTNNKYDSRSCIKMSLL